MKSTWHRNSLSEISDILNGLWTGKKPPYVNVGVIRNTNFSKECVLDTTDIAYLDVEKEQYAKRRLQYGDIILEKSGGGPKQPVGRPVLFDLTGGEYSFSNFTSAIRCNRQVIEPHYLHKYLFFLYLNGVTERMQSHSTGIRNLKLDEYKALEIPFPTLPEQKRIVAILDEAFSGIARAKETAVKNIANARELFERYLHNLFEKPTFTHVERRVEEVADVRGGFAFKSDDFVQNGKYQVIRMGNVRPGQIRMFENPVYIDKIDDKTLARSLLKKNDIIITQTGTRKKRDYGYTTIIEEDHFLLNQRLASIYCSESIIPKYFLYYSWSNKFRDQFFANETGTVGQGNVGIGAITNAVVPIPSVNIQREIVAGLDCLFENVNSLQRNYGQRLSSLEELKKALLHQAFSGALTGTAT